MTHPGNKKSKHVHTSEPAEKLVSRSSGHAVLCCDGNTGYCGPVEACTSISQGATTQQAASSEGLAGLFWALLDRGLYLSAVRRLRSSQTLETHVAPFMHATHPLPPLNHYPTVPVSGLRLL